MDNKMQNSYLYHMIFIIGLVFLNSLSSPIYARVNQKRGELLGGGGTNFSDRKKDQNGLLTGTHSEVRHLFGIYTEGAYSTTLFTNPDICTAPLGYAYGGGFCYDFQYYYFKMQIGLGIKMQNLTTHVNDITIHDDHVSDAWGYPYNLKYDFKDRIEHSNNAHLQIPLLLGSGHKNLYALAGVKINLNLNSSTHINTIGTTTGTYDQFSGIFEEMDNHGLRKNVPIDFYDKRNLSAFDIMASLEIGGEWGTKYRPIVSRYRPASEPLHELEWRVRIAAFVDFGLLTPKYSNPNIVEIPTDTKWDFCTFKMNNILSSNTPHNAHLHNFYAGIKLTVFIGSLHYVTCVICGSAQSEADMEHSIKKRIKKTHIIEP